MNSNLKSPNQEPEVKTGEIHLINPSLKEFKTSYFDDNNKPVEVVLAPLETKAFPRAIGEVILRHLIDFVLNQGGFSYKTDVNIELAKIRERCVLYE
jgi:hypothetical protein